MQLPKLSDAELKEHLQQPLIAKLATLDPGGTIRITPLWFHTSDDEIIINNPEANPHAQNLMRNPQCSILIDTPQFPSRLAHYKGRAELESRTFTADEIARRSADHIPHNPTTDDRGLRMEIWFPPV